MSLGSFLAGSKRIASWQPLMPGLHNFPGDGDYGLLGGPVYDPTFRKVPRTDGISWTRGWHFAIFSKHMLF